MPTASSWWHTLRARFRPPAPARDEAAMFALQRSRLANGLRLWVKPRPGAGTVMLLLQVAVGSRHETKQDNGISHFLEHMLFTGTRRWNEQEVVEVIRRQGGASNARTAREDTVYWLHLKAEDLELGLDWLAEVVFHPTLPEAKFGKERHVIIQEKGGEIGALEQVGEWIEDLGLGYNVFRAVRHRLYPKSSLLLPVIGDDRSLRRIKYADLQTFYRQHYVPNNMTLIAVGDVTPEQVTAGAERIFGGFPAGRLPPRPVTPAPQPSGFSLRLRGPSVNEQGQILLGAPLPGLNHPDRWALGVLAEILDNTLTQDIRYKRGLVYGIDVYPALYTDVGYFVVYTVADSSRFPEILAEVEAQIGRALRGEFEPQTVAEAKSAIRGRLLLGMESNSDFGWWLTSMSLIVDDQQPVPNLFEMVDAVTPADVARVAHDYLSPEKRYQAIHRPGVTPARLRRPALLTVGLAALGLSAFLFIRRRKKPAD
ncbi:MAG: insulinase family protein [Anaerolineales bacterium]|nr:insulinase family protein [Anaerolineales bacterium]